MARRPAERPTQRGATACKAVCGRTAVQDTTIPGYAWPSGGLGRKPNKGCEICGDHASECEQMFWLFLERGTRSPDASKIPVDEIVEEWRSRSSRGRYEDAMWTAAGLEEPRSRWEKQEGREPTCGPAEEDGARAFEGDETMDNLRAHPQWQ